MAAAGITGRFPAWKVLWSQQRSNQINPFSPGKSSLIKQIFLHSKAHFCTSCGGQMEMGADLGEVSCFSCLRAQLLAFGVLPLFLTRMVFKILEFSLENSQV